MASTSASATSSDMVLRRPLLLLVFVFQVWISPAWGADQEAEISRFLQEVYLQPPAADTLWLTGELRPVVRSILEHDYPAARLRYWRSGQRTAWVLEEIGKEMPITVGIAVDNDAVERVRVLVYRESRGWEVKTPAFTAQFAGARLTSMQGLDRHIDGISGATLSVRALSRLARLALLLHRHIVDEASKP
ncbi:MAG: FMN-binding protein [Gallionella sp.]|nr:FMN-binding protein [Gallionella sp.]